MGLVSGTRHDNIDRRQKTEFRIQNSEARSQKADNGREEAEGRGKKTEDR